MFQSRFQALAEGTQLRHLIFATLQIHSGSAWRPSDLDTRNKRHMTIEEFLGMLRAGRVLKRPIMIQESTIRNSLLVDEATIKDQEKEGKTLRSRSSTIIKSSTEEREEQEGRFLTVVQAKQIYVNSKSLYFDDVRPKEFHSWSSNLLNFAEFVEAICRCCMAVPAQSLLQV